MDIPSRSRSGEIWSFGLFVLSSLCVALRSHVRPLTHTSSLDLTSYHITTHHTSHITHHFNRYLVIYWHSLEHSYMPVLMYYKNECSRLPHPLLGRDRDKDKVKGG